MLSPHHFRNRPVPGARGARHPRPVLLDQAPCREVLVRSDGADADDGRMTSTSRLSRRIHDTTGRLCGSYVTTIRTRPDSSMPPTPEMQERSRREATRRARQRVEEIVYDFDLRLLSTFTYRSAPAGTADMFSTLAAFTRRLRDAGLTMPRLTVPELSPGGRWHLHMATPTYPGTELMTELWGHGQVTGPDTDRAGMDGALGTMASYLTKNFDSTTKGTRRYTTSAGLRPLDHRFTAATAEEALDYTVRRLGVEPAKADLYGGIFMAFFNTSRRSGA